MLPEEYNRLCTWLILLAGKHYKAQEKQKKKSVKRLKTSNSLVKYRKNFGQIQLLNACSDKEFFNYMRMDRNTFQELSEMIKPFIYLNKSSISLEERLALTLRFLASGNSFADLKFLSGISSSTISIIIVDTCKALNKALKSYIKLPQNENKWKAESKKFENQLNFPHALGAMDGKHIYITKPSNSGDLFYNYKGRHSIVLFALVNADLEYLMVDVGSNGKSGDSIVLKNTTFYKKLMKNELNIPKHENISNSNIKAPYVFLGDCAFAPQENILKPFSFYTEDPRKVEYNKRICRARNVVERTFGLMGNRFRVIANTMLLEPDKAKIVTLTCCFLHNFLQKRKQLIDYDFDSKPIESLANEPSVSIENETNVNSNDYREQFMEYFCQ